MVRGLLLLLFVSLVVITPFLVSGNEAILYDYSSNVTTELVIPKLMRYVSTLSNHSVYNASLVFVNNSILLCDVNTFPLPNRTTATSSDEENRPVVIIINFVKCFPETMGQVARGFGYKA